MGHENFGMKRERVSKERAAGVEQGGRENKQSSQLLSDALCSHNGDRGIETQTTKFLA